MDLNTEINAEQLVNKLSPLKTFALNLLKNSKEDTDGQFEGRIRLDVIEKVLNMILELQYEDG